MRGRSRELRSAAAEFLPLPPVTSHQSLTLWGIVPCRKHVGVALWVAVEIVNRGLTIFVPSEILLGL
jgi:hypothetical protein